MYNKQYRLLQIKLIIRGWKHHVIWNSSSLFSVLIFVTVRSFITRHFKANEELSNKLLMHTLLESRRVRSNIRCAILCDNRCNCFNFNSLSGMCRLYSLCDLSDTTTSEAGWTYFTKLTKLTKLTPQLVGMYLENNRTMNFELLNI